MHENFYGNEINYERLKFLDFKSDILICKLCGCIVHESKLDIHNSLHRKEHNDQYSEG